MLLVEQRSVLVAAKEESPRSAPTSVQGVSVAWPEYARIIFVVAATLSCWLGLRRPYATIDMLGWAAVCIGGYPIFKRAVESLLRRQLTVDFSWALAVVGAFYVNDSSTALTLILFALMARTIGEKTIARGRRLVDEISERRFPCACAGVEKALQFPAPIQATTDWILRFLLYISLGAAFFTLLTTGNVRSAISVIVVAGACGLTSGPFLPILGAMAQAARRGVRIKAVAFVEELAIIDIVVLDETVLPFSIEEKPRLRSDDKTRSNARRAMTLLGQMNIETILFTNELQPMGQIMGDKLGVNRVEGELFPEDKICKITALQHRGRRVALLNDGMKDNQALLEADVGVVIDSKPCVAEGVGDVIVSSGNLCDFADVLAIAKRTRRILTVHLLFTTIVASVGAGLALGGLLTPIWAIVIRFTSELALIVNAMRLLPQTVLLARPEK